MPVEARHVEKHHDREGAVVTCRRHMSSQREGCCSVICSGPCEGCSSNVARASNFLSWATTQIVYEYFTIDN